ncbi:MAG: hypothetical protein Q8P07_06070 [bacterium]|nr:hypothetical protein [bacterium]
MKNELNGKTVVVSVFSRLFRNADREESLEWTVAGQTISAGIVRGPITGHNATQECVSDIIESFREANPKSIELRFPAVKIEDAPAFSRKQSVKKRSIAAFKAEIKRMTLLSIAE